MSYNNQIVPGFDEDLNNEIIITLRKIGTVPQCLSFELKGHIDTYNSGFFQKQVNKVIAAGYIYLIFNANGLNYLSSTGIGSFTSFLKTVKTKNGDVVFVGMQSKVFEIFQLLGFQQFFKFSNTIEDAILFFTTTKKGPASLFPKTFACPICDHKLRASKNGRFRCPSCKTVLLLTEKAEVLLG